MLGGAALFTTDFDTDPSPTFGLSVRRPVPFGTDCDAEKNPLGLFGQALVVPMDRDTVLKLNE